MGAEEHHRRLHAHDAERAAWSGTLDARLDHANGNAHCLELERTLHGDAPDWWPAYSAAYWAELAHLQGG